MALNLDTLGLSAAITDQGIVAPDYQTILDKLTGYFRQIYGEDAYLDPDSKDGQMLAIYALGLHDANNVAIDVYNSFSPATGRGRALAGNVKINGITRKVATNSTADVVITGEAGTFISSGSVRDANNMLWDLPVNLTIPAAGNLTVTATCRTTGQIAAVASSINKIATPTRGWISVTNPAAAAVGAPVETDAALRIRQSKSVALASVTPFIAIDGAIANIAGVTRHKLFENDTGAVDTNGLPAHSISAIIDGGDTEVIAQTIRGKKGQGVATFGKTAIVVQDKYGNPHTINFSRPADVPVFVDIKIKVFTGYTALIAQQMKTEIAAYINGLGIGESVLLSRVYSPANLGVVSGGNARYYDISELKIGKSAASVASANIPLAYDEAASCKVDNIIITVEP